MSAVLWSSKLTLNQKKPKSKMSDRPSRAEVLKLSLDEYIHLYVHADHKNKIYGRRGPYPSQAQQRRRYEHSHYFAPAYQRQQQQQQRLQQQREEQLRAQQQERLKLQREQQLRLQQQREQLNAAEQLQGQQQQRMNETLETLCISQDCISQLRQEQQRLQQQSLEEMRLLQQRLRQQRQQGVEEMRLLQQRHRQQRMALQQRIDDEERTDRQRRLDQHHILQLRTLQQHRREQKQLQTQQQQQRLQQLLHKQEQRRQAMGVSNYKMLLKLASDMSTAATRAQPKEDAKPAQGLLMPPRFVVSELPSWYIPPKLEYAASVQVKKEEPTSDKKMRLSSVQESVNLSSDLLLDRAGVGVGVSIKKKVKFDLKEEYVTNGISTEEVIAEIEDQMKEEIEMEDDINSDMLYIPTNFSLSE